MDGRGASNYYDHLGYLMEARIRRSEFADIMYQARRSRNRNLLRQPRWQALLRPRASKIPTVLPEDLERGDQYTAPRPMARTNILKQEGGKKNVVSVQSSLSPPPSQPTSASEETVCTDNRTTQATAAISLPRGSQLSISTSIALAPNTMCKEEHGRTRGREERDREGSGGKAACSPTPSPLSHPPGSTSRAKLTSPPLLPLSLAPIVAPNTYPRSLPMRPCNQIAAYEPLPYLNPPGQILSDSLANRSLSVQPPANAPNTPTCANTKKTKRLARPCHTPAPSFTSTLPTSPQFHTPQPPVRRPAQLRAPLSPSDNCRPHSPAALNVTHSSPLDSGLAPCLPATATRDLFGSSPSLEGVSNNSSVGSGPRTSPEGTAPNMLMQVATPLTALGKAEKGKPKRKRRNLTDNVRRRKYSQQRAYKKRKRAAATLTLLQESLTPGEEDALIVYVDYNPAKVPGLGYLGPRNKDGKICTLEEAMGMGLSKHEWDGRKTVLFVDRATERIIVILAGHGGDPTLLSNFSASEKHLRDARLSTQFTAKQKKHRRGTYETLTYGYSYGGGQRSPGFLKIGGASKSRAAANLYSKSAVESVVAYHNKCLETFAPRLAVRYQNLLYYLNKREQRKKDRIFGYTLNPEKDAFAATTFNIGKSVSTCLHYDCQNFGPGLCLISSFGRYDYKKGGHIILWELGIVVEFPPYSTILIPSAIVKHGNTPISEDEERMSITQYTAGGLIRWAAYAFKRAKDSIRAQLPMASQSPMSMFMTIDEFECKRGRSM